MLAYPRRLAPHRLALHLGRALEQLLLPTWRQLRPLRRLAVAPVIGEAGQHAQGLHAHRLGRILGGARQQHLLYGNGRCKRMSRSGKHIAAK